MVNTQIWKFPSMGVPEHGWFLWTGKCFIVRSNWMMTGGTPSWRNGNLHMGINTVAFHCYVLLPEGNRFDFWLAETSTRNPVFYDWTEEVSYFQKKTCAYHCLYHLPSVFSNSPSTRTQLFCPSRIRAYNLVLAMTMPWSLRCGCKLATTGFGEGSGDDVATGHPFPTRLLQVQLAGTRESILKVFDQ